MKAFRTEIIRRGSADEVIAKRNRAYALYEQGLRCIADAMILHKESAGRRHGVESVLGGRPWYGFDRAHVAVPELMERVRHCLDADVWRFLMELSGLRNLMDATAVREFYDQLDKEPPEVTKATLVSSFAKFAEDREMIFRRGVVVAFSQLDRAFRTNNAFCVGPKVIMHRALREGGLDFNHYRYGREQVADLDRIFHVLDGKAPKDANGDAAAMILDAGARRDGNLETEYMSFRCCQNGNLHVAFRRADLLKEVNKLIAAHFGAVLADDDGRQMHK